MMASGSIRSRGALVRGRDAAERAAAVFAAAFLLLTAGASTAPAATGIDPDLLSGMTARSIGPAGMSGRVAAVAGLESDPTVLWVGTANGGVFKSVNAGLTWKPVFDDQPVASIGAVAVFQPSPDLVWVGTGEGNPRNSVSVGAGVYRSRDGGETWDLVGLERTERIHRVLTHPSDPDVVYVAALGRAWGENDERGVYRTTDGGATWERVLYVDERTGAADIVMDPSNPRKLIAAMWDYRRRPWTFRSGGPGSGLYVTHDAGESWTRLTPEDGLPEGPLGRCGVAFAPSDPRIVYAIVEARKNGIYRSEDGGKTWKNTGAERNFGNRPFYYADIRVDPERPNRVYSLWSLVSVSEDGGKTWRVIVPFKDIHPDHHAMWIDPGDARRVVLGNDGGVALSHDRGETWRFVENLPLAQYYHVRVDDDVPYNVYGGLQDNGSWRGPSEVWENGGIRNHHWEEVGFGDGFDTVPDPSAPGRGYAMSQEGFLLRWDVETGERRMLRPAPPEGLESLRFSWNAGFEIDPFDPRTVWFGSQFVHRSRDRGETWEVVSGDLTTSDPERLRQAESGGLTPDVTGAENSATITVLAASSRARGVVWAGTDDGRLHVSRDDGDSWTSVEGALIRAAGGDAGSADLDTHGVRGAWIVDVEPSRHADGAAWVVVDDHRRSNFEPYVFYTEDYGDSFARMSTDGVRGWAHAVAEDPVDPDLVFLGTEHGLWLSLDRGRGFVPFRHGVPPSAARDLVVHPRDHDLVVATHGRGVYVLDDISPLRSITPETLETGLVVFDPPVTTRYIVKQTGASRFPGHGEFRGDNAPYGATITFSVHTDDLPWSNERRERERLEAGRAAGSEVQIGAEETDQDRLEREELEAERSRVHVTVYDASGVAVRHFHSDVVRGVNRVTWDLARDPFDRPRDPDAIWNPNAGGPRCPPGDYRVVLRFRDHEAGTSVRVVDDPRREVTPEAHAASWALVVRTGAMQEDAHRAVERVRAAREAIDLAMIRAERAFEVDETRRRGASLPEAFERLDDAANAARRALEEAERSIWQPPGTKGIPADDDAMSAVRRAYGFATSSIGEPTPAMRRYADLARERLDAAIERVDAALADEVDAFAERAASVGVGALF